MYEIPQQLAYKEKIIFGLTFEQLLYALLLPTALLIFLRTHWDLYIRLSVAFFLSFVAIMFMFFDFRTFLKNWIAFLKFRKADYYDMRMVDFLEVRKVEKHSALTKSGRVAMLQVHPINFAIKTQQEQQLIIDQFKKFLNSLDFPIQILMGTTPMQITNYLNASEKGVSQEYRDQFIEYRNHLSGIINENKHMNRNFYVVIPEKGNLDIQVGLCQKRLKDLGLETNLLTADEIFHLYAKFFEGDPQTLCPNNVENNINYLQVNDTLNRVVVASGYPRLVDPGFLDRIITTEGDFDLSIHIEPFSIETMMVGLNKELQKQRADLYSLELKNIISPSLEIQYNDTRLILESLQKGKEKLFNISLYVNCRAKSLHELDLLQKRVESELNSVMIVPKLPLFRMVQGFKSTAPLAKNTLGVTKNITSTALSAFFPFTSPFLKIDETGIFFGLNKTNNPVIRDVFKLSNFNGTVLASSGSGKSYFTKLLIARHILNNTKVIIIDPQGEYKRLVKKFDGEVISLNRTSKTMINPLDLMNHDYAEKRLSLMDLMQVMLGELTEPQKSFIDKALTMTYQRKGITNNPETWTHSPPRLTDLLESLQVLERAANNMEKMVVRSLINRLSMYVDGVFSFLNQKTQISFNKNVVCFDIGDMPKQVKPVIMFLVLDFVYLKMKRDIERKVLIIDEAWSLLERTEDASYVFEIVKTCRKFNMGMLLINQEVEGLLQSKAGKSVLANSSYTLLMRQKASVMKLIQETFDLSHPEVNYLLTASVGEGILIMENEHSELKIISSPAEHALITTNADEILKMNGKTEVTSQKQREVNISIDEDYGYYLSDKISTDERSFALSKGYKEYVMIGINGKKQKYLLKPRGNESVEHLFLTMEIFDYLKRKGAKASLFESARPDIVINVNGKKIGIEVETGQVHQKQLEGKVLCLKRDYADWFFVVSDKNLVSKYRKFGKCFEKRNILQKLEKMPFFVRRQIAFKRLTDNDFGGLEASESGVN
jgi:type IV secretory pathway VirB4 component